MKICINCEWEKNLSCTCPKNMKIDLVTGVKEARWIFPCYGHRSGDFTGIFSCRIYKLCGKEGRWFKQKENGKKKTNETN